MRSVVALLGRGDTPADGVADYCANLAEAFVPRGIELITERFPWYERGWLSTFWSFWRDGARFRGRWVFLHYTALGWSRRGFPFGAVAAMVVLRLRGARCGVMLHEPWHQGENHVRLIDRVRAACQDWVVRGLQGLSSLAVFSLPLSQVPWLDPLDKRNIFIPLGPNVLENLTAQYPPVRAAGDPRKTVCVFCVSQSPGRTRELSDISCAVRAAGKAGAALRVVFVGRGTESAAKEIAAAFEGSGIEVKTLGLQDPPVISRTIVESDVLLCVRSALNLRRGSALAGIACGVPMVAYAGGEQNTPLTEAGILFAPLYDQPALGAALARVLLDDELAGEMHRKNIEVERKYFSWETVTRQYMQAMQIDQDHA